MAPAAERIFHLALLSEFRAGVRDGAYAPRRLVEDGFVHCADRGSVLAVAADYFADASEPVLLLEIDPERLGAPVVREAAAPIPGGGGSHLEGAALFPHVYGSIALAAIAGVAPLVKRGGAFTWPDRFAPVREVLGRGAVR
jgi:uncharacterized protein (DUF952 family)